jgi:CHAT domain-containing protein
MATVASDAPLHVVADGALGGLPFAALIARGKRLIELRPIAIAPSLGAPAAGATPTGPPVVIGSALPSARAEAGDVAAIVGVKPILDGAATTDVVRGARTASLLHVAAHGGIDARGAYIDLADRRLDATDVVGWKLAPRLVVLASCASGARPGRTMWGAMGAAFLVGGSRTVVATLWSVADEPTRRLVAAFYAAGGAERPSIALAIAQRAAIADGRPASEWAPFVVLGAP